MVVKRSQAVDNLEREVRIKMRNITPIIDRILDGLLAGDTAVFKYEELGLSTVSGDTLSSAVIQKVRKVYGEAGWKIMVSTTNDTKTVLFK